MAGYRAVDHGEGRWNGVAMVVPADVEVTDVHAGLPGEPDPAEARWIEATVHGIRFASIYVVNGRDTGDPMFQQKLDFLDAAHDRLAELVAAGPVVVAGDWNVAPDDRDVWDPALFVGATHVTPDERSRSRASCSASSTPRRSNPAHAVPADRAGSPTGTTAWARSAGGWACGSTRRWSAPTWGSVGRRRHGLPPEQRGRRQAIRPRPAHARARRRLSAGDPVGRTDPPSEVRVIVTDAACSAAHRAP